MPTHDNRWRAFQLESSSKLVVTPHRRQLLLPFHASIETLKVDDPNTLSKRSPRQRADPLLFEKQLLVISFELSFLRMTSRGWRYHSSQKLTRGEFDGEIDEIGFRDFENVKDKVFF